MQYADVVRESSSARCTCWTPLLAMSAPQMHLGGGLEPLRSLCRIGPLQRACRCGDGSVPAAAGPLPVQEIAQSGETMAGRQGGAVLGAGSMPASLP